MAAQSLTSYWQAALGALTERLVAGPCAVADRHVDAWRWATRRATFYFPLPHATRKDLTVRGRWLDREEDPTADRIGLDPLGRPVVRFDGPEQQLGYVWRYDLPGVSIEEFDVRRAQVRRLLPLDRTTALVVETESISGHMLQGVQILRSPQGALARVEHARRLGDGATAVSVRGVVQLDDGLRQIQATTDTVPRTGPPMNLEQGLRQAAQMEPDLLTWDGRTETPEPWPADCAPLIAALAAAFAHAIAALLPDSISRTGWLEVRLPDPSNERLPPSVTLIPDAAIAVLRRRGLDGLEILDHADWSEDLDALALRLDVTARLSPSALRACRAISTALRDDATEDETVAASEVVNAVASQLGPILSRSVDGKRLPVVLIHGFSTDGSSTVSDALRRAEMLAEPGQVRQLLERVGAAD